MQENHVITVNERDEWTGTVEKMRAHREGILHRAFSVFILNERDEMLIQQRAEGKYHSAGLWSNACCSHPLPGETTEMAAHRRLQEELGIDCTLYPLFHFRYRSEVGNDLVENEYDHIFIGRFDEELSFNPEEVKAYQYISLDKLNDWLTSEPEAFTQWFQLVMPMFRLHLGSFLQKS